MTGQITWRSAIDADRERLKDFTCAPKPTRSPLTRYKPVYEKPWAHAVQSGFRDLRLPLAPGLFLTVGVDDDGIVAAAHYRELNEEQVHIELVAVAKRAHRQGLAAELASVVRNEVVDRWVQLDRDHLLVTACVHPENAECRAFCESAEFAITGQTGTGYDVWSAEFYLFVD